MKITKKKEGSTLTIALEDSLDTVTAPDLENELKDALDDVKELVFDLNDLKYVSSAGLRVLFAAHKTMDKQQGKMSVKNVSKEIMGILEMTGFYQIFNVEAK